MRPTPTLAPDRGARRLRRLVWGVTLLGAAAVAVSAATVLGLRGEPVPAPPWHLLAGYALLAGVGSHLRVMVRIRSARYGGTWCDAVVLVGLATLPAPWVVLATAAAVLVARLATRTARPQLAVAVARNALSATVGWLVLVGLGPGPGPVTAGQAAWLTATFVAMALTGKAVVVPAVCLASGTRLADRVLEDWDLELLAMAVRLLVALVALLVLERQAQLAYALPLLVLVGHVWHERWLRGREERRSARELAAATAAFAAAADLTTLLRRAVAHGSRLFSAEVLEVELTLTGALRLVRGGPDGVSFDGEPADAPPDPERGHLHEVTLHGPPGRAALGTLRLRFRGPIRLAAGERATLARYAGVLETAVRHRTGSRIRPAGPR